NPNTYESKAATFSCMPVDVAFAVGTAVPAAETALAAVAQRWLQEVPDESLQVLIESAAAARTFNQEFLAHVTGAPVSAQDFRALTSLSFVQRSRFGWSLHDLLRKALTREHELRAPNQFRQLQGRMFSYWRRRLGSRPAEAPGERLGPP